MLEFLALAAGVAMMFGGYKMATTGYDLTRKPPLFYLGWACILLGGTLAQGAVFYMLGV